MGLAHECPPKPHLVAAPRPTVGNRTPNPMRRATQEATGQPRRSPELEVAISWVRLSKLPWPIGLGLRPGSAPSATAIKCFRPFPMGRL
eukprot:8740790-Alexandrium_andersonii.AAC.1